MRRTILLLASGLMFGQPPTASVTELLASNEPSQLAWGAYLAANNQQKDLIPAIIPLLKSANSDVQLTAIDALIRLDADVPEEDLTAFLANNRPDPALVLLARDPNKHADFLMQMLDRQLDPGSP